MARASSAEAAFGSTVTFPGGAVVPDWSSVTTPSARAALTALFAAFIGSKWRGMDGVEERVRRAVLQAYAADGRSPVPAQIAAASGLPSGEVGSALQRLAGRDLVVLDGAGRVTGAYPFTDGPSEHQVEVSGVTMSAMCAIDALGIGAMLERDCMIPSACRQCRRTLAIHTPSRGRELEEVEPGAIVVWSGRRYASGCAASSLCTLQAFFCDDDHLAAWCASGPVGADDGIRLCLAEALEVGRAIFAPMRMEMRPWLPTT